MAPPQSNPAVIKVIQTPVCTHENHVSISSTARTCIPFGQIQQPIGNNQYKVQNLQLLANAPISLQNWMHVWIANLTDSSQVKSVAFKTDRMSCRKRSPSAHKMVKFVDHDVRSSDTQTAHDNSSQTLAKVWDIRIVQNRAQATASCARQALLTSDAYPGPQC